MVAHVDSGLIDICGSGKRSLFNLQYLYLLSFFSTVQGRVQAIQSRTDDQFIHFSSCR